MIVNAEVKLARVNGIPEDAVINAGWHFTTGPEDPEVFGPMIEDRLHDFYNLDVPVLGLAVRNFLSGELTGDYTLTVRQVGVTPQPVLYFAEKSFVKDPGDSLPAEVSIALSYQGAAQPLTPGRAKGRIFIGPLSIAANATGADGLQRPSDDAIEVLRQAADRLRAANDPLEVEWGVWSGTGSTFSATLDGWVDNAFDTIRSRGPRATARNIWPA